MSLTVSPAKPRITQPSTGGPGTVKASTPAVESPPKDTKLERHFKTIDNAVDRAMDKFRKNLTEEQEKRAEEIIKGSNITIVEMAELAKLDTKGFSTMLKEGIVEPSPVGVLTPEVANTTIAKIMTQGLILLAKFFSKSS